MPICTVGDTDLYYELRGEGPALLLIPGLGGDVRMFRSVIDQLARRRRVVAFDPRGAGRSGKPDIPYTIETMADDAAGLLQTLGIERADVLGFSMGGRIALDLALRHAELVRSLTLACTSARTLPSRPLSRRSLVMAIGARLPLPRRIDPQPRYAHMRQREASRAYDCSSRLVEIGVPTLVVHGRKDHMVPYELAVELQRGIGGSRLIEVQGGHMALITSQRRRLVELVNEFLG